MTTAAARREDVKGFEVRFLRAARGRFVISLNVFTKVK
jgi:hypothetical protein